jgi:hypothetical protein
MNMLMNHFALGFFAAGFCSLTTGAYLAFKNPIAEPVRAIGGR